MATPACMGGMCVVRERCEHYHQVCGRGHPIERLCELGKRDAFEPIRIERQPAPLTALVHLAEAA